MCIRDRYQRRVRGLPSNIMANSFVVSVPVNAPPGSLLSVQAPNGSLCQVQVPAGCVPGSQFTVSMAAQHQAQSNYVQQPPPPQFHHVQQPQFTRQSQQPLYPSDHNSCNCMNGPGSNIEEPINVQADPEALVGQMRDGCFSDCCHNVELWFHAVFCTQCLLGQIWEKLIGPRGHCCVVAAVITLLAFVPYVGGILSYAACLVVLCQLVPVFVRRYQIPHEQRPHVLSMIFCQPCVLAQMARHMEDFDRHPEKQICCQCCNPTLDYPHPNYLWEPKQQPQQQYALPQQQYVQQQPVAVVQSVPVPTVTQAVGVVQSAPVPEPAAPPPAFTEAAPPPPFAEPKHDTIR
eukprot:TRINITY_DN10330_c0_g1_i1.p1 TRINITY_DN10330_c0_g1~~TRINITY_DN10330_c0_g1_i1.p1  ORF type:complete len:347 (+),score=52.55 TRINITY_DN10330_c0_g1_i1:92-1132(+)